MLGSGHLGWGATALNGTTVLPMNPFLLNPAFAAAARSEHCNLEDQYDQAVSRKGSMEESGTRNRYNGPIALIRAS
jgi:hypothetical protein